MTRTSSELSRASEINFLPSQGSYKVCVHTTILKPYLWDYARYIVAVEKEEEEEGILEEKTVDKERGKWREW